MSFEEKDNMLVIAGAGSTGGESHTPYEEPDNLQSSAFINVVDLIGEGQIGGLVDASRSVFLNGTALVGSDGSKNYESVSWDTRVGTQNQTHLEGFANVETPYGVGVEMKTGIPVPFTVSNPRVDRVRLSVAVSALLHQKDNGDVVGSSVNFEIRMSINDGAFETLATKTISGKASSRYQRSYLIDLPKTAPNGRQATRWTFQIIRVSPESTSASLQNTLIFENYAEVINRNFTYPNSAIVGMRFDAEAFSSVPKREYLVDGLLIKVPNNYDPVTRTYSGVWNGGFKLAATSNPAWILYDLLLNKRYGLGEYIDVSMVDEAKLYQIGQYCDQLVDDGFGNKEPRYTINCVVNKRAEAYDLITDICTCFNGMGFWAGDQVSFMIDAPSDPVMAFTTANIIGEFTYTGSSLKDRHSIVAVTWNDPSDNYKQVVEYVEDPDLIERYGVRKVEIQAFGCTSRGQAHRVGRWLLYTEHYQSEVVNFKAGLDSALVMPGDLIQIQDEDRSGKRMGGRLLKCEKKAAWLDDALDLNGFDQLKFAVLLEDGKFVERKVTSYALDEIEIGSTGRTKRVTKVSWATDLEKDPVSQAVWVLSSPNLEPVLARVVNVKQGEEGDTVEISAIPHNPSKYLAIENDMMLEVPITSILDSRKQEAPAEVRIKQEIIKTQGIAKTRLVIDWDQAKGASKYRAEWKRDEGNWIPLPDTSNLSAEVDDIFAGIYTARVRAENIFGATSYYTYSKSADLQGKTGTLANVGVFNVTGVLFGYEFEWIYPSNSEDYAYVEIQYASLSDYSDAKLFAHIAYPTNIHSVTGLQGNLTTYFRIKCVDKAGNESEWSEWVEAITDADPEKVLEVLEGHIGESLLDKVLTGKIEAAAVAGDVAEKALESANDAVEQANRAADEARAVITELQGFNDDLEEAARQSAEAARQALQNAEAIAQEVRDREAAILQNAEAILQEARDREAAILQNAEAIAQEARDREAAILQESRERTAALEAITKEVNESILVEVEGLQDGLSKEIKARQDGDTSTLNVLNAYKLSNDDAVAAVVEKADLAISNDAATSRRVDGLVTQISNDKTEITGQISEVRESVTTLEGNTNNKITALESSMNTKLNSKANASALNDYYTKTAMEDKALEIAAGEVNKFNASLQIGGTNLIDLADVQELGISSTIVANKAYRGFTLAVQPGEVYSISRPAIETNRFRYCFTSEPPAAGVTLFGQVVKDTELKLEGIVVPEGAAYLFLYLSNASETVTKIKVERGHKATDWSESPNAVQRQLSANSKAIDDTNVVVNQIDGLVSTHASKISTLESNYDKVDAKAGTAISNAATAQQTAETAVNASQSTASSLNKLEAKFESSRDSDSLVADYLMKDPNQWVSHYNYDLTGYFVTVTDGKIGNTVFRKAEANNCWNYNLTTLPKGKYKLSMWVRRTEDSSGSMYFTARVANGADPNFASSRYISNNLGSSLVPTTNEWTLVEKVWDVTNTEWEQFQFGFAIGHGSGKPTWEMQGFKVAKVISDADTDGSFASNASLNTIQKTLADADKALGTRIDNLTTTVSNDKTEVKGLIKDVSDSVTTLEGNTNNKITQLESSMNTKLGKKADSTALSDYYTKTQMEDKAATITAGKVEEFSASLKVGTRNYASQFQNGEAFASYSGSVVKVTPKQSKTLMSVTQPINEPFQLQITGGAAAILTTPIMTMAYSVKATLSFKIKNIGTNDATMNFNGFEPVKYAKGKNRVLPGEEFEVVVFGQMRPNYDWIQFQFRNPTGSANGAYTDVTVLIADVMFSEGHMHVGWVEPMHLLNEKIDLNASAVASVQANAEELDDRITSNTNAITKLGSDLTTAIGKKLDATVISDYYTKTQTDAKATEIAAGKVEEFSAGLSIGGNNLFSLKNVKNYTGGNLSNAAYYTVTGRQVKRSGGGSNDRIGNEIAIKDPAKGLILTFAVVSGTVDNVLYYRCLNASGAQVKAQATVTGTRSGDVVTCKIPAASIPATTAKMNIGFGGAATTYTVTDVVVANASVAPEWSTNIDDVNSVISTNAEILSTTKALAEDVDGRVKTQTSSINSLTSRTTAVETQASQADQLARMLTSGKLMHADPTFKEGMGGVAKYSTSMSTFTIERVAKSSDNPTTSTHEVRIRLTDEATSRLGGFVQTITSRANAVFLMKYIIKLPVGLKLVTAANSLGTGSSDKFIGSVEGTGKYETYYRITKCGTGGSFSTGGHVYAMRVSGATLPTATADAPIDWFLASVETYDTTDYEDIPPAVRTTLANYQQSINTLTEENAARVKSINELNTELGKKASTSAMSVLEGSVSDIDGKVSANTSAIDTLKGQVGDKSIAEVLNSYYTKNEADAAIAGQVKEFSSKLAAVGANQLLNSEAERSSTASTRREYLLYESSAHLKAFYDANLGEDVTVSFEIKVPVAGTVQIYSSNGSAHSWSAMSPSLKANTWTKVAVTVKPAKHATTPTAGVSTLEFYGTYDTGRIPTVRKVQLEAGSVATAWAPSLRDTNATLGSHATAIDNTYTKAETNSAISTSVNSLKSTLETAIGKKADASALNSYYTKTETDKAVAGKVETIKASMDVASSSLRIVGTQGVIDGLKGAVSAIANLSIVADSTAKNGFVLRVGDNSGNDQAAVALGTMMQIDPEKTYRIRARFRRVQGEGTIYIGLNCANATKTNVISKANSLGAIDNVGSSDHYTVSATAPALGTWTETVHYFKGKSTGSGGGSGTLASPFTFAARAAYFAPMFIANYSGKAGITDFDYIVVEDAEAIVSGIDNATAIGKKLDATVISGYYTKTQTDDKAEEIANAVAAGKVEEFNSSLSVGGSNLQPGTRLYANMSKYGTGTPSKSTYTGLQTEVGRFTKTATSAGGFAFSSANFAKVKITNGKNYRLTFKARGTAFPEYTYLMRGGASGANAAFTLKSSKANFNETTFNTYVFDVTAKGDASNAYVMISNSGAAANTWFEVGEIMLQEGNMHTSWSDSSSEVAERIDASSKAASDLKTYVEETVEGEISTLAQAHQTLESNFKKSAPASLNLLANSNVEKTYSGNGEYPHAFYELGVDWEVGSQYTLLWCATHARASGDTTSSLGVYAGGGNQSINSFANVTKRIHKVTFTKTSAGTAKRINFYLLSKPANGVMTTATIHWAVLVKGNALLTDDSWIPSPYDFNAAVQEAKSSISTLSQTIANDKLTLAETLNTMRSEITEDINADVSSKYYTKAEIDGTVIAGKLTTFQTSIMNPAIETAKKNVDSLVIPDTRSTNQAPSWYWTNYPKKTVTEFKNGSSIGSPGGIAGYGTLTTVVPWTDSSGGAIRQIFESGDSMNVATRYSTSTTAWSAWKTDLKTLNTSITETTNTINGVKGIKTVTIDNNGVLSGYGLISELVNGKVTSAFGINADNFYIGAPSSGKKPFIVTTSSKTINGTTYPAGTWIDSAYIASATIKTAHIEDGAITNAKIKGAIQSNDYVANSKGWKIDKAGTIQINGSGTNGRVEITDKGLRIYNASGVVVVEVGLF